MQPCTPLINVLCHAVWLNLWYLLIFQLLWCLMNVADMRRNDRPQCFMVELMKETRLYVSGSWKDIEACVDFFQNSGSKCKSWIIPQYLLSFSLFLFATSSSSLFRSSRCLPHAPVVWVPTPRGLALQPSRQNLQSILVVSGEVQIVVVFSDVNEADPADRLILVVL